MRAQLKMGDGSEPRVPITPAFAASFALGAGRQIEGDRSAPGLTPPCQDSRQERRFRETES
jgi:hypothetical protein